MFENTLHVLLEDIYSITNASSLNILSLIVSPFIFG